MPHEGLKLLGVELYFEDVESAKNFYQDVLGLTLWREQPGRFAQFGQRGFICLEKKGSEEYPSEDKGVLFLGTRDLSATIERIGGNRILRSEAARKGRPAWAVLHDPEGHNILLMKSANPGPR